MTNDDNVILVNATSSDVIIKLPDLSQNTNNIDIKRIDSSSYVVTIVPFNTETIEFESQFIVDPKYGFTLISDGSNWYII